MLSNEILWSDWLEVKSYRRLHYSRRTGRCDRTEPGICLLKTRCTYVRCRTSCSWVWIRRYQSKCHASVYICEIRMVEDIVNLPPQLKLSFLFSQGNVFEECEIAVEDGREAHVISRQVPDLTRSPGLQKTSCIKGSGCSRGISSKIPSHRITDNKWACVHAPTCEICDRCADMCLTSYRGFV